MFCVTKRNSEKIDEKFKPQYSDILFEKWKIVFTYLKNLTEATQIMCALKSPVTS